MLMDYQQALENLDKANGLEPSNAFTFSDHEDVKMKLKDYQGTLEDVDKAHVFKQNLFFAEQCWDVEASNKLNYSSI